MNSQKQLKAMQHSIDSMSPPEDTDTPEVDEIPHQFWRSDCCELPITERKNGTLQCECGWFCKVDAEKSFEAWSEGEQ